MRESSAGPDAEPPDRSSLEPGRDELTELRTILIGADLERLIGADLERLGAIQARLDDTDARRRDVGEVLPDVLLQHALDPHLAKALAPGVERAITASVRQNPAPLADALFPVMGPAIRKAVAAALASMVESLNRTLDLSVSWQSIFWRVEAFRTGKSFAEVVLLHTLLYRVEQVFLIDRSSGLLLQHVHQGTADVKDVDMFSGMLTAIRDFVQDSFRMQSADALEALKVGDLSIWIEQGPRAVIAAVIRGAAPREYRARLQSAIETLHLEFSEAFEHFSGDADVFTDSRPVLESCLHAEYRPGEARPRRRLWVVTAAATIGLAIWAGYTLRERSRWNHYLDALRAEPGIVVVSSGRRAGRFVVTGLRDPLARDPEAILRESSLAPVDVDARWESYHTSQSTLAVARARTVLQPPPGVTLELRDGVLSVTGEAPPAWTAEATRLAPLIPGIVRLDASRSLDAALSRSIARLHTLTPLFVKGRAQLAAGQDQVLGQLRAGITELQMAAAAANRRFKVDVIGHADSDGAPQANLSLSRTRAEVVRAALAGVPAGQLEIVGAGVGSEDLAVTSPTEADKARRRRVTVRVIPLDPR